MISGDPWQSTVQFCLRGRPCTVHQLPSRFTVVASFLIFEKNPHRNKQGPF